MLHPVHRDAHLVVLEHDARLDLAHLGPHRLQVALAHRIGGARLEIGVVGAVLEQVVDEVLRAFGAQHQRRTFLVKNPA
ncbi:hypothetical protein D3C71_2039440 [compost metagenome]